MARIPRRLRKLDAERVASDDARIMSALKSLRYKSFDVFAARNSHMSLRQMAEALGVPEATFFGFHSRWIDGRARSAERPRARKVAP